MSVGPRLDHGAASGYNLSNCAVARSTAQTWNRAIVLPYWLLFSLCAAGALESRRHLNRAYQGGPLLMLAALFVILIMGLRFEVGGDWINYIEIYEEIRHNDLADVLFYQDPGYTLLNWLAQQIGAGIWFVNLACAVLFTWGLVKFARHQPNPWLVFVIAVPYFVIVVGMGYTRQAVAIAILLAGLATIHQHSIFRFGFYVVLAALFHKSAIVILPLVGLSVVQQRGAAAFLILILGVLLYYALLQNSVDRLIANYEVAARESEGAGLRVGMNVLPAALFLLFSKRFGLAPGEEKLWRIFSYAAFGMLGLLLVLESSTAVDRTALYLIPVQLFVLSRLPYAFPANGGANGQLALLLIAYSAAVQFVWLNYAKHAEFWVPYKAYILSEDAVA